MASGLRLFRLFRLTVVIILIYTTLTRGAVTHTLPTHHIQHINALSRNPSRDASSVVNYVPVLSSGPTYAVNSTSITSYPLFAYVRATYTNIVTVHSGRYIWLSIPNHYVVEEVTCRVYEEDSMGMLFPYTRATTYIIDGVLTVACAPVFGSQAGARMVLDVSGIATNKRNLFTSCHRSDTPIIAGMPYITDTTTGGNKNCYATGGCCSTAGLRLEVRGGASLRSTVYGVGSEFAQCMSTRDMPVKVKCPANSGGGGNGDGGGNGGGGGDDDSDGGGGSAPITATISAVDTGNGHVHVSVNTNTTASYTLTLPYAVASAISSTGSICNVTVEANTSTGEGTGVVAVTVLQNATVSACVFDVATTATADTPGGIATLRIQRAFTISEVTSGIFPMLNFPGSISATSVRTAGALMGVGVGSVDVITITTVNYSPAYVTLLTHTGTNCGVLNATTGRGDVYVVTDNGSSDAAMTVTATVINNALNITFNPSPTYAALSLTLACTYTAPQPARTLTIAAHPAPAETEGPLSTLVTARAVAIQYEADAGVQYTSPTTTTDGVVAVTMSLRVVANDIAAPAGGTYTHTWRLALSAPRRGVLRECVTPSTGAALTVVVGEAGRLLTLPTVAVPAQPVAEGSATTRITCSWRVTTDETDVSSMTFTLIDPFGMAVSATPMTVPGYDGGDPTLYRVSLALSSDAATYSLPGQGQPGMLVAMFTANRGETYSFTPVYPVVSASVAAEDAEKCEVSVDTTGLNIVRVRAQTNVVCPFILTAGLTHAVEGGIADIKLGPDPESGISVGKTVFPNLDFPTSFRASVLRTGGMLERVPVADVITLTINSIAAQMIQLPAVGGGEWSLGLCDGVLSGGSSASSGGVGVGVGVAETGAGVGPIIILSTSRFSLSTCTLTLRYSAPTATSDYTATLLDGSGGRYTAAFSLAPVRLQYATAMAAAAIYPAPTVNGVDPAAVTTLRVTVATASDLRGAVAPVVAVRVAVPALVQRGLLGCSGSGVMPVTIEDSNSENAVESVSGSGGGSSAAGAQGESSLPPGHQPLSCRLDGDTITFSLLSINPSNIIIGVGDVFGSVVDGMVGGGGFGVTVLPAVVEVRLASHRLNIYNTTATASVSDAFGQTGPSVSVVIRGNSGDGDGGGGDGNGGDGGDSWLLSLAATTAPAPAPGNTLSLAMTTSAPTASTLTLPYPLRRAQSHTPACMLTAGSSSAVIVVRTTALACVVEVEVEWGSPPVSLPAATATLTLGDDADSNLDQLPPPFVIPSVTASTPPLLAPVRVSVSVDRDTPQRRDVVTVIIDNTEVSALRLMPVAGVDVAILQYDDGSSTDSKAATASTTATTDRSTNITTIIANSTPTEGEHAAISSPTTASSPTPLFPTITYVLALRYTQPISAFTLTVYVDTPGDTYTATAAVEAVTQMYALSASVDAVYIPTLATAPAPGGSDDNAVSTAAGSTTLNITAAITDSMLTLPAETEIHATLTLDAPDWITAGLVRCVDEDGQEVATEHPSNVQEVVLLRVRLPSGVRVVDGEHGDVINEKTQASWLCKWGSSLDNIEPAHVAITLADAYGITQSATAFVPPYTGVRGRIVSATAQPGPAPTQVLVTVVSNVAEVYHVSVPFGVAQVDVEEGDCSVELVSAGDTGGGGADDSDDDTVNELVRALASASPPYTAKAVVRVTTAATNARAACVFTVTASAMTSVEGGDAAVAIRDLPENDLVIVQTFVFPDIVFPLVTSVSVDRYLPPPVADGGASGNSIGDAEEQSVAAGANDGAFVGDVVRLMLENWSINTVSIPIPLPQSGSGSDCTPRYRILHAPPETIAFGNLNGAAEFPIPNVTSYISTPSSPCLLLAFAPLPLQPITVAIGVVYHCPTPAATLPLDIAAEQGQATAIASVFAAQLLHSGSISATAGYGTGSDPGVTAITVRARADTAESVVRPGMIEGAAVVLDVGGWVRGEVMSCTQTTEVVSSSSADSSEVATGNGPIPISVTFNATAVTLPLHPHRFGTTQLLHCLFASSWTNTKDSTLTARLLDPWGGVSVLGRTVVKGYGGLPVGNYIVDASVAVVESAEDPGSGGDGDGEPEGNVGAEDGVGKRLRVVFTTNTAGMYVVTSPYTLTTASVIDSATASTAATATTGAGADADADEGMDLDACEVSIDPTMPTRIHIRVWYVGPAAAGEEEAQDGRAVCNFITTTAATHNTRGGFGNILLGNEQIPETSENSEAPGVMNPDPLLSSSLLWPDLIFAPSLSLSTTRAAGVDSVTASVADMAVMSITLTLQPTLFSTPTSSPSLSAPISSLYSISVLDCTCATADPLVSLANDSSVSYTYPCSLPRFHAPHACTFAIATLCPTSATTATVTLTGEGSNAPFPESLARTLALPAAQLTFAWALTTSVNYDTPQPQWAPTDRWLAAAPPGTALMDVRLRVDVSDVRVDPLQRLVLVVDTDGNTGQLLMCQKGLVSAEGGAGDGDGNGIGGDSGDSVAGLVASTSYHNYPASFSPSTPPSSPYSASTASFLHTTPTSSYTYSTFPAFSSAMLSETGATMEQPVPTHTVATATRLTIPNLDLPNTDSSDTSLRVQCLFAASRSQTRDISATLALQDSFGRHVPGPVGVWHGFVVEGEGEVLVSVEVAEVLEAEGGSGSDSDDSNGSTTSPVPAEPLYTDLITITTTATTIANITITTAHQAAPTLTLLGCVVDGEEASATLTSTGAAVSPTTTITLSTARYTTQATVCRLRASYVHPTEALAMHVAVSPLYRGVVEAEAVLRGAKLAYSMDVLVNADYGGSGDSGSNNDGGSGASGTAAVTTFAITVAEMEQRVPIATTTASIAVAVAQWRNTEFRQCIDTRTNAIVDAAETTGGLLISGLTLVRTRIATANSGGGSDGTAGRNGGGSASGGSVVLSLLCTYTSSRLNTQDTSVLVTFTDALSNKAYFEVPVPRYDDGGGSCGDECVCVGAACEGCRGEDCTTCTGSDCRMCQGPDCTVCSGADCASECVGLDCPLMPCPDCACEGCPPPGYCAVEEASAGIRSLASTRGVNYRIGHSSNGGVGGVAGGVDRARAGSSGGMREAATAHMAASAATPVTSNTAAANDAANGNDTDADTTGEAEGAIAGRPTPSLPVLTDTPAASHRFPLYLARLHPLTAWQRSAVAAAVAAWMRDGARVTVLQQAVVERGRWVDGVRVVAGAVELVIEVREGGDVAAALAQARVHVLRDVEAVAGSVLELGEVEAVDDATEKACARQVDGDGGSGGGGVPVGPAMPSSVEATTDGVTGPPLLSRTRAPPRMLTHTDNHSSSSADRTRIGNSVRRPGGGGGSAVGNSAGEGNGMPLYTSTATPTSSTPCGGQCRGCEAGAACEEHRDCIEGRCVAGMCAAEHSGGVGAGVQVGWVATGVIVATAGVVALVRRP